jgi:hypothetical protein
MITGISQLILPLTHLKACVREDVRDGVMSIKVIFPLEVKCNIAAREI